jgi:hypothetical protein
MSNENWNNDAIQFPRLLSEMLATVDFTTKQREALAESMDLTWDGIGELLDRADHVWQDIKQRTTGGEYVPDRWAQHSAAFQAEHPWCGWTLAFSHGSDWDTTGFGLERLVDLNILLTTADGRSRPVNITQWQVHVKDDEGGILVHELDTKDYEHRTDTIPEFVRYEDIREIVVY